MLFSKHQKMIMVAEADAIVGRSKAMPVSDANLVLGKSMTELPKGCAQIQFAMGCFWGAERRFWQQPGVVSTSVGYAGGFTENPSYEEVCSGQTGHTEVVRVFYEDKPQVLKHLLSVFWEAHDPTQGMRQGNDVGTQYRSAIYCYGEAQLAAVEASGELYQQALAARGLGDITTEIASDVTYYFAEDYHQQYLFKNPNGYCGLRGTGVSCELAQ